MPAPVASTMSERTQTDAQAADAMGTACVRVLERCEASLGAGAGAPVCFERCLDVPMGGVLCALPALLENGLLSNGGKLGEVGGYYTAVQILLVLAFMMLGRITTVEQLRKHAPGELGKLMGLDRIPEARCLRQKMDALAGEANAEGWAAELARSWLEQTELSAGFLYVDGHVKVYGGQIELPRRFASRQRLCLRGISFYWVNDAIGQPFFVFEKQIDRGMLEALRSDIIPRLLNDVPNQPSEKELEADPNLHRFIIVFDREGYSPAFFKEVWDEHRIACTTYQKNCTDDWPDAEFEVVETTTPRGEPLSMKLAERGTYVGKDRLLVKEIRKLTDSGHQTSIVATAKTLEATLLAPHMFARWSQENFTVAQARALLQGLFKTSVDLVPSENTLNIHLHGTATPVDNQRLIELLDSLNGTESLFPGTEQKMVFHSRAARGKKRTMGQLKFREIKISEVQALRTSQT